MEYFGRVKKLFVQDSTKGMIKKQELVIGKQGAFEDKFYGKNLDRAILLTSFESYKKACVGDINLSHGQLGENILLDLNPCKLPFGTKLKIGNVVIQITNLCTTCKNLTRIDPSLPECLKEDRGIFAKIIEEGKISKNEKVYKIT